MDEPLTRWFEWHGDSPPWLERLHHVYSDLALALCSELPRSAERTARAATEGRVDAG